MMFITILMLVTAINNGPDDASGVNLEFDIVIIHIHGIIHTRTRNRSLQQQQQHKHMDTRNHTKIYRSITSSIPKSHSIRKQNNNQTTTCYLTKVDQTNSNSTNNISKFSINTDPSSDIGVNQTYTTYTNNGKTYVTYTTTINNGPDNATGLQIIDKLPKGLTYISKQLSNDNGTTWNNNTTTYNTATGIWTIGNFNNTDPTKILTITAEITTTGTIKN